MQALDYAAPMQGDVHFVQRPDGTRIRTVSVGSADHTVLLAHGYGFSADGWNMMAPKLEAEGMRVIAFDQRGHGDSTIGSDGVSTELMAVANLAAGILKK